MTLSEVQRACATALWSNYMTYVYHWFQSGTYTEQEVDFHLLRLRQAADELLGEENGEEIWTAAADRFARLESQQADLGALLSALANNDPD